MAAQETTVFVDNQRVYAHHGVHPQEGLVGAWFSVSVRVTLRQCRATRSDSIEDTISYADLANIIRTEMAQPSQLLENVAQRILDATLHACPQAAAATVRLTKENPPMGVACDSAGVEINWRA